MCSKLALTLFRQTRENIIILKYESLSFAFKIMDIDLQITKSSPYTPRTEPIRIQLFPTYIHT